MLYAYNFFRGASFKTRGCTIQNQYTNAGMPEPSNSILRVWEGSSVLGIRVDVV